MNIDILFSNFELFNTPEKIQKLKQAILQLAIQGKLMLQDPKDEPASELIKKIKAEKENLIKKGKLKKEKPLPTITKEQIPNELPKGWTWVRFGEIISCYRGHNPPKHEFIKHPKEGYIRFIQITDFKTDKSAVYVPISDKLKYVNIGEIIMAAYRHIGKLSREMQGAFNVALCKIMEIKPMSRDYIETLIPSDFIRGELLKESERAHIPSMHTEHLRSLVVPIPPLREQKRIVEKVDELFSRADEIETMLKKADEEIVDLNKSALNQLLESKDEEDFRNNFEFIVENFDLLYSDERNVKELRQAILQLAVQGKLVQQDPNDKPASELIKKIKAEKEKLIKEGKLKKEKPLPRFSEDEPPYKLPNGWEWVRLEAIGEINPRNEAPDNSEASFIPMNLISEKFGETPRSEKRKWSEIKNGYTHFKKDDVVLAKITPCFENSKAGVMKNLINGIGAGTTELHVFRGDANFIIPEYAYIYFKTPKFLSEGKEKMTGTAGHKRIPKEYVFYNPFPLPPTNEQKRIVEKVDQLMKLCDELESKIVKSKEKSERLIGAILQDVFKQ